MYRGAKKFLNTFVKKSTEEKHLILAIKNIVGKAPINLPLYKLALIHSSMAVTDKHGNRISNERLEYLGDAILGAVVADFLFKKYPFKDEGFLTRIRSRIVNRESLNNVGRRVGLESLIKYEQNTSVNQLSHKSLYGDTLEALIGAVYLDRGYRFCQQFIIHRLINPYFNIQEVIRTDPNHKSKIIEWAQRENKEVNFEIIDISKEKYHKEFTAEVLINGESLGKGFGTSKKKAEQDAALKACEQLGLEES